MNGPMNKTSNLKRAGATVVLGSGSEDLLGENYWQIDYLCQPQVIIQHPMRQLLLFKSDICLLINTALKTSREPK